jgi:hypothetical protein
LTADACDQAGTEASKLHKIDTQIGVESFPHHSPMIDPQNSPQNIPLNVDGPGKFWQLEEILPSPQGLQTPTSSTPSSAMAEGVVKAAIRRALVPSVTPEAKRLRVTATSAL